jgi:hypothetical protein
MKIINELKEKYTSTELVILFIAIVLLVIGFLTIESKNYLTVIIAIAGAMTTSVIFISKLRFEQREERKAQELNINFNGFGGLVIDHLVVNEFNYLLRFITDGELESFSDFQKISKNQVAILNNIELELTKEKMKEEDAFNVSRATAEGNMKNLANIVSKISTYYKYQSALKHNKPIKRD